MKKLLLWLIISFMIPNFTVSMGDNLETANPIADNDDKVSWKDLPNELKIHIMHFFRLGLPISLVLKELKTLRLVSHEFQELADNPLIITPSFHDFIEYLEKRSEERSILESQGIKDAFRKACKSGDIIAVQHFLKNIWCSEETAAKLAIEYDQANIVKILNPNLSLDAYAFSPVMFSLGHGRFAIAKKFLKKNQHVTQFPELRAVLNAIIQGNSNELDRILQEIDQEELHQYFAAVALTHSAAAGNIALIELIVKRNGQINGTDDNGLSPLICAARFGHISTVEFLILNGAEVDLKIQSLGKTALMFAAQYGHKDIVELLLKHGARFNEIDSNYHTALYYAVKNNHQEVINLLHFYGANLTSKKITANSISYELHGSLDLIDPQLEEAMENQWNYFYD